MEEKDKRGDRKCWRSIEGRVKASEGERRGNMKEILIKMAYGKEFIEVDTRKERAE